MKEKILQELELEPLMDLLSEQTSDLLKAIEKKDKGAIKDLEEKVELIQSVIYQKRGD